MEDQIFGFNVPKPEKPETEGRRIDIASDVDLIQMAKNIQLAKHVLGVEGECAPYPWCRGNPTVKDCIRLGYCARDPNCGE